MSILLQPTPSPAPIPASIPAPSTAAEASPPEEQMYDSIVYWFIPYVVNFS